MREYNLEDYVSKKEGPIEPRFGAYDKGLLKKAQEKPSLYEKIIKYGKGLVAAAVLAAGVLNPGYANAEKIEKPRRPYFEFIQGSVDKKYDNHNLFVKDSLDEIVNCCHKVYKHVTVEITDHAYKDGKRSSVKTEKIFTGIGSAAVIENNGNNLKLLTCDHIIGGPPLQDKYDSEKRVIREYKVKEIHYILEETDTLIPEEFQEMAGVKRVSRGPELRVIARDKEHDIAILQTKKKSDFSKYKAVKAWGNSSELRQGDFLYCAGYPGDRGKHIIHGYVSSYGVECTKVDDHYVYMDLPVIAGNSGGPVFALRDGKPELVGIARCSIGGIEGMGGAVGVDYIKRLLRRVKLGRIIGGKNGQS